MNNIELVFDKSLTKLAGNSFGQDIFDTQVKGQIDYTKDITIMIPERIDSIASSFVQGFFDDFVANIGIAGIEKQVNIISSITNCKQMIIDNLL